MADPDFSAPYGRGISRGRTLSTSSLDPYEDPVSGLARISSNSNLQHQQQARRRRARYQDPLARRRESSETEDDEATLSSKFESLNYEICENELYRSEEQNPSHQVNLWMISRNRWLACFLIGVCTALVAVSIDIAVHSSSQFKFEVIIKKLISDCSFDSDQAGSAGLGCMWKVETVWIAYNCLLVLMAGSLVVMFAPVAGGSGIPQIKCFLNGIAVPQVIRLKTLVAKAIGVACAVAGGLSAGKEGPMIHSGGVVGAGVSQGRSVTLGLDSGIFKQFRNDRERRDFVSVGAACGVAAAFGAPIGGVLFSLEEGASFYNQSLTWRMVFASMTSAFTVNLLLSIYHGRHGWLSWTGLANFGVFENKNYNIWEIPFFLAIGVIGGLLGALFNHLNSRLAAFRKKYVCNRWQRLLECLLVAACSAFMGFATIYLVDDCQQVGVNPDLTSLNQMWCKKGEYSAVANLFFQNPEESVKSLFHSPINSFRPWTLLIFAIEYFLLTMWTFGLSVPSGVFIPALLTGAAWGRLVGIVIEYIFPDIAGIDPGKYALAGAAAQLGGIVRMTISLTAIIMEATKDITFGLPIMLVLMIAKWVGDIFNEGLYDTYIELSEIPILGWNPPKMSRNISAQKVMRADVVALERRERVSRLVDILKTTSHHGFPVVDRIDESVCASAAGEPSLPDYGRLKGIILRSQLLCLLKNKMFMVCDDESGSGERESREGMRASTEARAFSEEMTQECDESVECLGLSPADTRAWVDLEPYMHPFPHRVPLHASLPHCFKLFRGLGLRYLAVVNDDNRLRGIITRKDVARFRERRDKKTYTVQELFVSDTPDA